MQSLNKKKWLPFVGLLISLSSCDTPKPPDVPACEHLSQYLATDEATGHTILMPSPACEAAIGEVECGHCVYIVSGKEIFVGEKPENQFNKKAWSQLRKQSVYLPAVESYSPIANYMINACHKMKCDKDIDRFRVKMDSLNGVGDAFH